MNDELREAIRTSSTALQAFELAENDLRAILPGVEANAAIIARLASRVGFEDEPALYPQVIESAKG